MLQSVSYKVERNLPDKFAIHPDANFNVGLRPVFDVFQKPIMAKKEVYRKDTGKGLSVVSNTYKVRSYEKAINHFNEILKIYNLPRGKLNRVKEWIERCQRNFQGSQS